MEYVDAIVEITRSIGEPAFALMVEGKVAGAWSSFARGGLIGSLLLCGAGLCFWIIRKGDPGHTDDPISTELYILFWGTIGAAFIIVALIILSLTIDNLRFVLSPEGSTAVWLLERAL